jgi:hypothetical protein
MGIARSATDHRKIPPEGGTTNAVSNICITVATSRRGLLASFARVAAAFAVPVACLAGRVIPTRYVQAIRSRRYPGPRKKLSRARITQPGRWKG